MAANFNPRQSYKVTAPVARSTAYDYNATLTKSHTRMANPSGKGLTAVQCNDDEDRDVMPHEVLFEHKGRSQTNNARICSASSVNGMQLGRACVAAVQNCLRDCGCAQFAAFQEPMMPEHAHEPTRQLVEWLKQHPEHRAKASDTLTSFFNYMGVAVTGCTSGPRGGTLQRQGFSATRGGLMTVVNTGDAPLRAGDKVRMVIDVLDVVRGARHESPITGIPRTKIVARLAHLPETSQMFSDVADGVTTRDMTVHMHNPGVLTPKLEYMGRNRYPWDWNYLSGETVAQRRVRLTAERQTSDNTLTAFIAASDAAANGGAGPAINAAQGAAYTAALQANEENPRAGLTRECYVPASLVQQLALTLP